MIQIDIYHHKGYSIVVTEESINITEENSVSVTKTKATKNIRRSYNCSSSIDAESRITPRTKEEIKGYSSNDSSDEESITSKSNDDTEEEKEDHDEEDEDDEEQYMMKAATQYLILHDKGELHDFLE